MPRKAKTIEAEVTSAEANDSPAEMPAGEAKPLRGVKTAAIKRALRKHKNKSPKEIAELLTAAGLPTKGSQVSNVKSFMASKRKVKTAPTAAEETAAAKETAAVFDVSSDAVSLAALQKAKKLIQELGGVANARRALNALGRLLD